MSVSREPDVFVAPAMSQSHGNLLDTLKYKYTKVYSEQGNQKDSALRMFPQEIISLSPSIYE